MEQLKQFIRRPWGLAATAAAAILVLGGIGFGAYQLLNPQAGVLPLGPSQFVQGEFLVKFKPGAAASDIAALHQSTQASEKGHISQIGVSRMTVPPGASVTEMVTRYQIGRA